MTSDTETPAISTEMSQATKDAIRVYQLVPEFGRLRDDVLFGDVWKQADLSLRDRSMVTCAVLAAMGRSDDLAFHVKRAVDNGVTTAELRGMAVQIAFYGGWSAGVSLGKAALPIFEAEQ